MAMKVASCVLLTISVTITAVAGGPVRRGRDRVVAVRLVPQVHEVPPNHGLAMPATPLRPTPMSNVALAVRAVHGPSRAAGLKDRSNRVVLAARRVVLHPTHRQP